MSKCPGFPPHVHAQSPIRWRRRRRRRRPAHSSCTQHSNCVGARSRRRRVRRHPQRRRRRRRRLIVPYGRGERALQFIFCEICAHARSHARFPRFYIFIPADPLLSSGARERTSRHARAQCSNNHFATFVVRARDCRCHRHRMPAVPKLAERVERLSHDFNVCQCQSGVY